MENICIIVNPVSANGKGLKEFKLVEGFLKSLKPTPKILFTEYPKHAIELSKSAFQSGFNRIISFGGDGTHNEVLNGILVGAQEKFKKSVFEFTEGEIKQIPILAVVSIGSGNDFRKTLKLPKDVISSLKIALTGEGKLIDVGLFEYVDFSGNPKSRFFLNILSGGFSGEVTDKANKGKKSIFRGLIYTLSLISTLLFITIPEGILKHGENELNGKFFEFDIANGKYFGGGMCVSPKADITDGLLNISVFKNYTGLEVLFKIKKLFDGTILTEKKLYHDFAKEIFVKTDPPSLIEADGEVLGYTPVKAVAVNKIIKVVY
ncbi:diacylglycerol/lipid kinase family protein [Caldisericum exile]|uniref:Lipid kinase n=1 Tax=Caldisericum exile (strain DSM 21853 / NBRC 104410 / AZM16c01) TaxID=511051 RepID=A0A7U6GG13_CALEA|nr:diacylglycerol kinase family protein [Caldisericum exile]BAL81642.1 putative lipid kinase [Caldisericum exile AZM16c01]